jgi:alpha-galactosidase
MLSVLKNQDIIAINQDPVYGTSISPFRWGINVCYCFLFVFVVTEITQPDWTSDSTYPAQFWSGPSENGTVIMLVRPLKLVLSQSDYSYAPDQYSESAS